MISNTSSPKIIKSFQLKFFQKTILSWFDSNGREFPWRRKKLTRYQIIIAEVLLQRTKAETVSKYFKLFIKKYPNWKSIKEEKIKILQNELKPLGLYEQRSVLLKKLAVTIIHLNGKLPKKKSDIERLPYAGQYITNAILQYIYNEPAPLLDVNMARVLERFFGDRNLADIRYDPYLQKLSFDVVNHSEAKKINWGILDFAAIVCKVKPLCASCPMVSRCKYALNYYKE